MTEPKIHFTRNDKIFFTTSDREVHMCGESVAVCWNIKYENRSIKGEDGLTYKAEAPVRDGDPYIDFVSITIRDNISYEDEDSPVEGGITLEYAEEIYEELAQAIVYLRSISRGILPGDL